VRCGRRRGRVATPRWFHGAADTQPEAQYELSPIQSPIATMSGISVMNAKHQQPPPGCGTNTYIPITPHHPRGIAPERANVGIRGWARHDLALDQSWPQQGRTRDSADPQALLLYVLIAEESRQQHFPAR